MRSTLEALLGRPLKDNEAISVHAYESGDVPDEEVRETALEGIKEHLARIDRKLEAVPQDELESAVDEAIRSVRPGYQPIR